MKIKEIMNTDLKWVTPNTDLKKTAEIMEKYDVGVVPVCNDAKQLLGMVTDRDIVIRNIAEGKDPGTTMVKDIMTSGVKTGRPDMSLDEACEIMSDWQVRRLPIVDNEKLVGLVSLGDIALVPGLNLKNPKGIRDVAEWYMATATSQEYIKYVFDKQTDIALVNLAKLSEKAGDKIDVLFVCGTDFGTQISTFCSPDTFRELYMPYYKKVNSWIHENTSWKTFKHSCGAIEPFIPLLIESGFDILNPVQCSAVGMEPSHRGLLFRCEYHRNLHLHGPAAALYLLPR